MNEQKRVLTFFKRAEKCKNRIIIPKSFINKHGNEFYMEMHDDVIILRPYNRKKEGR